MCDIIKVIVRIGKFSPPECSILCTAGIYINIIKILNGGIT